jgi:hypothetical protein
VLLVVFTCDNPHCHAVNACPWPFFQLHQQCHAFPCRKLWRERESAKPFDPMSLIERTGMTYVPPAYTKETVTFSLQGFATFDLFRLDCAPFLQFEKLQKLFVDEVLKLQAESRADKADKVRRQTFFVSIVLVSKHLRRAGQSSG